VCFRRAGECTLAALVHVWLNQNRRVLSVNRCALFFGNAIVAWNKLVWLYVCFKWLANIRHFTLIYFYGFLILTSVSLASLLVFSKLRRTCELVENPLFACFYRQSGCPIGTCIRHPYDKHLDFVPLFGAVDGYRIYLLRSSIWITGISFRRMFLTWKYLFVISKKQFDLGKTSLHLNDKKSLHKWEKPIKRRHRLWPPWATSWVGWSIKNAQLDIGLAILSLFPAQQFYRLLV